jgi:hypothetical protein
MISVFLPKSANAWFLLSASLCALLVPGGIYGQVRRPRPAPGVTQPDTAQVPASMTMRVEGAVVTAEIRATPLQRVLEEIAARTGVIFEVSSDLNPPVSISLYRAELQEAIQRIVGANDSIFYFQRDAAGQSRISFVRVFFRGTKGHPSGILYIGTGTPTKGGLDSIDTPEQALKALAESDKVEVKEKAIEALVAAKGDVAVQALIKVLNDPATEIQVAAIEGLARLGARSALPQILPALKHRHPAVRQSAVEAVALLGSMQNVQNLRPLAQDKDGGVAAAAEMAIRKLSSEAPRVP